MMNETNPLGYEELVRNCFSSKTLKTAKIVKLKRGPYIAQLVWDVKGTPHGDQIIWLLFSPRSLKQIDKILQQTINLANASDLKMLIIDHVDPNKWYAHEVLMLSDGCFTSGSFSLTLKDGSKGYIGWIVGQGRPFEFDIHGISGTLHTIISNLFYNKELKNNPFIKAGRVKLDKVIEQMKEYGATKGYYSPKEKLSKIEI